MCVTGQVTAEADLAMDNSVTMQVEECWTFTRGSSGTVCLTTTSAGSTSSTGWNECRVSFLGATCSSCQVRTCADGKTAGFVADCTNIDRGLTIDRCADLVVPQTDSPFFVFDDRFDFQQCSNGGDPQDINNVVNNNNGSSSPTYFDAWTVAVTSVVMAIVMTEIRSWR